MRNMHAQYARAACMRNMHPIHPVGQKNNSGKKHAEKDNSSLWDKKLPQLDNSELSIQAIFLPDKVPEIAFKITVWEHPYTQCQFHSTIFPHMQMCV